MIVEATFMMSKFFGGISLGMIIFFSVASILIYGAFAWQRNGQLFGFSPYKDVVLIDLLSFANFYDGKKICTQGIYIQTGSQSILKVKLEDEDYVRSAWIENQSGEDIITRTPFAPNKIADARFCGQFAFARTAGHGEPPLWNHKLTVEKFKLLSEPKNLN